MVVIITYMSRRRISAALLHQNHCLRESVTREFAALRANGLPKYKQAMSSYRDDLLRSLEANDKALMQVFGPAERGLVSHLRLTFGVGGGDVYDGLGSLWRHLAKDWTSEGTALQTVFRERMVDIVLEECRAQQQQQVEDDVFRVLVPGCGQGRLAYTLASALREERAHVTGLEQSEATLALARHMLDPQSEPLRFCPFLDAFANNGERAGRTAAYTAPDAPAAERQAVAESANLTLRPDVFTRASRRPHSHVVVTSFLLDCVEDLSDGVRAVHDALIPGGLWVFAGPLHYYQGGAYLPKPAPTLEELLSLASDLGFELEEGRLPERVPAPYVPRPGAFMPEAAWNVPLFACRKIR